MTKRSRTLFGQNNESASGYGSCYNGDVMRSKHTVKVALVVAAVVLEGAFARSASAATLPVLWDTAWILQMSSQSTVDAYLQARASQGFDAIMIGVTNWDTQNTPLGNGSSPFLANYKYVSSASESVADVSKPNAAGFAYIDHIIQQAATDGLDIALLPMTNGQPATYVAALTDAYSGENRAYNYGHWLGERYKGDSNVIWVLGGDVSPAYDSNVLPLTNSLAQGIRAAGATQPITFHAAEDWTNHVGKSSSIWFNGQSWLTFNMIQDHYSNLATLVQSDYSLGKPTGLGEGAYEGQASDSTIRSESYETYLSGGQYYTYGQLNNYQGQNSSETSDIKYCRIAKDLMVSRGWKSYVPDGGAFVVSSSGTAVATVKGHSAAMVYLPGSSASATVKLSILDAQSSVRVQRFNPTDGTTAAVGTYAASGSHTFTTGGLADAVILFDSQGATDAGSAGAGGASAGSGGTGGASAGSGGTGGSNAGSGGTSGASAGDTGGFATGGSSALDGGAEAGLGQDSAPSSAKSGCSCRMVGGPANSGAMWMLLLAGAALIETRRRS